MNDPILEWLQFINADSKEGMEVLAKKNDSIKSAYEILQKVSKNKVARMAYEARQAEIMDQLTREKTAREEGLKESSVNIAKNLLQIGIDVETVAKATGLEVQVINRLKDEIKLRK